MANELVLGLKMDPNTVAAMTAEQVRYWFEAATRREAAIRQQQQQG